MESADIRARRVRTGSEDIRPSLKAGLLAGEFGAESATFNDADRCGKWQVPVTLFQKIN